MAKDYYETLGVSKSASQDEIKKAYRKLAREHHPDMVAESDKKEAEQRFKEINEAYQVLKDPEKKSTYDRFGHAGFGGASGGSAGAGGYGGFGGQQGGQWGPFSYSYTSSGGGAQGFDPFDVFEDFFGFRAYGGQRKPTKGKNLFYQMNVDFADAVKGVEKEIEVESGKVTVKIPAGVRDGTELRFAKKGMPGPDDLPNGDLFLTLRVKTPAPFQRVGDDLAVPLELNFTQAILGDNVEVPIIDSKSKTGVGTTKVKVAAGTQHGTNIRLKGKGMPKLHGRGTGDIFAQVIVSTPKRVNRKQRKILEEYAETL